MTKHPPYFMILMAYLSLFGLGLTDTLRGALFPSILESFAVNNSQGSWFFIVTSLFSILAGISTHSLSRSISTFQSWRAGVFFMALGSLLIFLAPQFHWVLLGCAALGVNKKFLSGLHSMYGLASFLSPILVASFASRNWPWQSLFLVASLTVFLLFFVSYRVQFNTTPRPRTNDLNDRIKHILFDKRKVTVAVLISSYVAMEILLSTRLTSYLTQHLHWPLTRASVYLTYFFVALLSGRLLFSFLHFPMSTKQTLLIALLGAMAMILLGLRVDPLFLAGSAFFMAPFYPVAMAFLAERFPDQLTPLMGLTISLQSLFVIFMNLAMGPLTDLMGIDAAMNSAFAFGGISWLLLMIID